MKASNRLRTPIFLIASVVLSHLTGCQTTPSSYEIRADADPVVNRDVTGKPLSVVVRLYQLKQEKEFDQLTFDLASSGRSDADLFGESLLQRSEMVLLPGSSNVRSEMLLPETKYLGVIAYFRRPDIHYWRYLIDAELVREKGLNLHALDCYLRLNNITPHQIPGQPRDAHPICQSETIAATSGPNVLVPPAATAPAEKPRTTSRPRQTQPTAATQVKRVVRPSNVLPTPPEPVISVKPATAAPTINVNVTPSLNLPKWGGQ